MINTLARFIAKYLIVIFMSFVYVVAFREDFWVVMVLTVVGSSLLTIRDLIIEHEVKIDILKKVDKLKNKIDDKIKELETT